MVGVPDAELGERVKAIVRRVPGSQLDEAEVRRHVAAHLASFKVPELVEFTDEPLPRNAAGKLLKNLLRGTGAVPFDAANLQLSARHGHPQTCAAARCSSPAPPAASGARARWPSRAAARTW